MNIHSYKYQNLIIRLRCFILNFFSHLYHVLYSQVSKFFDVQKYREERDYVVENYLVKDISRLNTRHTSVADQNTG